MWVKGGVYAEVVFASGVFAKALNQICRKTFVHYCILDHSKDLWQTCGSEIFTFFYLIFSKSIFEQHSTFVLCLFLLDF